MLQTGYIEMTRRERIVLDTLLEEHSDARATFARRDPGESGPILVRVADRVFEVDEQTATEVTDG